MGQYVYWLIAGVLFGVANVIPGVSGGTMAVVFGIYERIIGFASDIRGRFKEDWKFILTLGIGAGVGILAFARFMGWVLDTCPALADAFFMGVILGSLPMLAKKAFKGKKKWRFRPSAVICALVTLAIMVCMFLFKTEETAAEAVVYTWKDGLWMLVLGAITTTCMIVPGISGSFVLVLLGGYGKIVALVNQCTSLAAEGRFGDLIGCWPVIPFAIGALAGVIYCSKLIKFLLSKYEKATYGAIFGFVLGSVLVIFPGFSAMGDWRAWLLLLLGIAAIAACDRFGAKE